MISTEHESITVNKVELAFVGLVIGDGGGVFHYLDITSSSSIGKDCPSLYNTACEKHL